MLSPHISVQVSADAEDPPLQIHPVSFTQLLLQPSPETVLPSSQKVGFMLYLFPSPQISKQTSGALVVPPDQLHPDSIPQLLLHPSPETVLPSSQYVDSELNLLLSPQISVQVSAEVDDPPLQFHPDSFTQLLLQPSPETVFPSSQKVGLELYLFPSPQISTQTSSVLVVPPDHVQPVSFTQLLLHPSPETVLPSSQ